MAEVIGITREILKETTWASFFGGTQTAVSLIGFLYFLNPTSGNGIKGTLQTSNARIRFFKVALTFFSMINAYCFAAMLYIGDSFEECQYHNRIGLICTHLFWLAVNSLLITRMYAIVVDKASRGVKIFHTMIIVLIFANRITAGVFDTLKMIPQYDDHLVCKQQFNLYTSLWYQMSDIGTDLYVAVSIAGKLFYHVYNNTHKSTSSNNFTYIVFSVSILLRSVIISVLSAIPLIFFNSPGVIYPMLSQITYGASITVTIYVITFEEGFYQNVTAFARWWRGTGSSTNASGSKSMEKSGSGGSSRNQQQSYQITSQTQSYGSNQNQSTSSFNNNNNQIASSVSHNSNNLQYGSASPPQYNTNFGNTNNNTYNSSNGHTYQMQPQSPAAAYNNYGGNSYSTSSPRSPHAMSPSQRSTQAWR